MYSNKRLYISFCVVFFIKILLSIYFAHLTVCKHPESLLGEISLIAGDYFSYIDPIESLIAEDEYYFINQNNDRVYAGRMPHYAAPYYLFRQVLSKPQASDAMVIFQILIGSIAIMVLALIVVDLTSKRALLFPSILIFTASSVFITPYDIIIQTESISVSLLVFIMFFFFRALKNTNTKNILWLGIFLGYLTVIRPHLSPLFIILGGIIFLSSSKKLVTLKKLLLGVVPVLLMLAPWWVRNSQKFDYFFPFQQDMYAGYGYSSADLAVRNLLSSMGEDASTYWEPSSMACYMRKNPLLDCTFELPSYLKEDDEKAILQLRSLYYSYQDASNNEKLAEAVEIKANTLLTQYSDTYPVRYWLLNRLNLVKKFLLNSGSFHLPIHSSNPCYVAYQLLLKLTATGFYLLSSIIALIGMWWAIYRKSTIFYLLIPFIYLIILFPMLFKGIEWRYLVNAYYFNIAFSIIIIDKIRNSSKGLSNKKDI